MSKNNMSSKSSSDESVVSSLESSSESTYNSDNSDIGSSSEASSIETVPKEKYDSLKEKYEQLKLDFSFAKKTVKELEDSFNKEKEKVKKLEHKLSNKSKKSDVSGEEKKNNTKSVKNEKVSKKTSSKSSEEKTSKKTTEKVKSTDEKEPKKTSKDVMLMTKAELLNELLTYGIGPKDVPRGYNDKSKAGKGLPLIEDYAKKLSEMRDKQLGKKDDSKSSAKKDKKDDKKSKSVEDEVPKSKKDKKDDKKSRSVEDEVPKSKKDKKDDKKSKSVEDEGPKSKKNKKDDKKSKSVEDEGPKSKKDKKDDKKSTKNASKSKSVEESPKVSEIEYNDKGYGTDTKGYIYVYDTTDISGKTLIIVGKVVDNKEIPLTPDETKKAEKYSGNSAKSLPEKEMISLFKKPKVYADKPAEGKETIIKNVKEIDEESKMEESRIGKSGDSDSGMSSSDSEDQHIANKGGDFVSGNFHGEINVSESDYIKFMKAKESGQIVNTMSISDMSKSLNINDEIIGSIITRASSLAKKYGDSYKKDSTPKNTSQKQVTQKIDTKKSEPKKDEIAQKSGKPTILKKRNV